MSDQKGFPFRSELPPGAPHFDEAQAYAASRRGLVSYPTLLSLLSRAAGPIREALDRGETVSIRAGRRELARYEP